MIAYQSEKLIIDLGMGGSVNADTDITPLRDGMPDIDYLLELGPRLTVSLWDRRKGLVRGRLNWVTAYRFAVSTDFKRLDFRGPVLNTKLRYRKDGLLDDKLSYGLAIGSTWLSNQMMDYFYSVDPLFATPTRPAYNADAGFLSVDLSASIDYDLTPNASVFVSAGLTSLDGSKNNDSPLFEDDLNARAIVGFGWKFYRSKSTVSVTDE